MRVTIVKVCESSFLDREGREVSGQYFYYRNGVGEIRRVFFTADRCMDLEYLPVAGDIVHLVQSGKGNIVDFMPDDI